MQIQDGFLTIEQVELIPEKTENMTWCIEPQGLLGCSVEQFFTDLCFEESLEFSKELIKNGFKGNTISFVIITGKLENAPEHFKAEFRKTKSLTRTHFYIVK